jgi:hypothetical protein
MGSAFIPRGADSGDQSLIKDKIENAVDPNQVPSFPAADAPAATTTPAAADSTK